MGILERLFKNLAAGGHHGNRMSENKHGYSSGHHDNYSNNASFQNNPTTINTINCNRCQQTNPAQAQFCQQCGNSLKANSCRNCNTQLAAGAKFCTQCGQAQS